MKLLQFLAVFCIYCQLISAGVEYNEDSVCYCTNPNGSKYRCLCSTAQQQQRTDRLINSHHHNGHHQSASSYQGASFQNEIPNNAGFQNSYVKPNAYGFYWNQNYL